MNSNAAPTTAKSAHELLISLETLAADSYVTGEHNLAFTLAAVAGAFARGLDHEIADVLEHVIGAKAKSGILLRLADEAARANASKN